MAKNKPTCVDLTTILKSEMRDAESRKGRLYRSSEYKYIFEEIGTRVKRQMWKCWVTIARCLYGKVTTNADHVQVQYYIPHRAYSDTGQLARMIVQQAENLAEQVEDVKLEGLVKSLQDLKPVEDDE